jgi:hypothetical protein
MDTILKDSEGSIESEYLEMINFFKDYTAHLKPATLTAMTRKNVQIAYWERAEKTFRRFVKWREIDSLTDEDKKIQLLDKSVEVVCPECKSKMNLRPVGEIILDDGLPYFQFYCWDCFLNFEAKKPNNTDALIVYYRNIIEDKDVSINKNMQKEYQDSVKHISSFLKKMEILSEKRKMNKLELKTHRENYLEFLRNDIVRLRLEKNKILFPKSKFRRRVNEKILLICELYMEWYDKRSAKKANKKAIKQVKENMYPIDYRLFK